MSPDPQDAYLGDGLTEELTSKLSRLSSLRVISRTSAMALKGTNRAVPAVARELDVQYVLEGSVRKAGDALRITAQLIDAAKDEHLWSESYSGSVEDVFGMQEKVSLAIVPEAIAIVDRMQSDTPSHLLTTLGVFLKHGWLGEKAEALATVTEELEDAASWDDLWPLCLAGGFATLGELDRAFYWLDHAVGRGIANLRYLKDHDPSLATLRSDPRFDAILAKAAVVSGEMAAAAVSRRDPRRRRARAHQLESPRSTDTTQEKDHGSP